MFLHIRLAATQTLADTMTSPVKQSTECPSNQCHWQVTRKAKEYHAQTRAEQSSQEYLFPANPIAESAPEDSTDALCKGKGGCDHADVHGNSTLVGGDVEILDHVICVWEDGHEGNGLAYPA
jgi:hypothetical protein